MKFELFTCPKCKENLFIKGGSLICSNNHCYDLAKEGYVNLMLANDKHSLNPGDNDDMVVSRDMFLNRDHYLKLVNVVSNVISKYKKTTILDAGCGTGYYTSIIRKEVENSYVYGIDISKKAVKVAAKKDKDISFAVASVFGTPFKDKTFDAVISIFSPLAFEEFNRVLKDDGIVVCVYPGEKHLIELKKIIYGEETILNDKSVSSDMFESIEKLSVQGYMNLEKDDISNLVRMTPYFYTTPKEKLDNLNSVSTLSVQYDFIVEIFKKN